MPTVVAPTCLPEWNTSIVQWKDAGTDDTGMWLTVKSTCSAGMLWLESCGLYGNRVAVTEVTFTLRFPGVVGEGAELGVAPGDEPQPRVSTPATSNPVRTDHGRITPRL